MGNVEPSLVAQALEGDRRALARLISLVEDESHDAYAALAALHPRTGRAHVVGVTGAPGTGKSTLVNELARQLRAGGATVGVVAVDPSSPFTGGALLGDRVRMRDLVGDPGVFVRSMASRGNPGGLAQATGNVVRVLDAAGFDTILVETVGAGQAEVDVAHAAHTTVVVEAPGLGDEVQALKAGLLEIADVLVVNKADRPGAARAAQALEMVINGAASREGSVSRGDLTRMTEANTNGWKPPIVQTIALDGTGVQEVIHAVAAHREHLHGSGLWAGREEARIEKELLDVLRTELLDRLLARVGREQVRDLARRIAERETDLYTAVRTLVGR
jgi:LAO/AO transport system kinase